LSFYLQTPNLSQRFISLLLNVRLIEHSRFALNSFFFKANDTIEIEKGLVNPKMCKKSLFNRYFSRVFLPFVEI